MLNNIRRTVSVLTAAALMTIGHSVPAFAATVHCYNNIIDVRSTMESAISILEQHSSGAYAYSSGLHFSTEEEAIDAETLLRYLLQSEDDGFCVMEAEMSSPRHFETCQAGTGFATHDKLSDNDYTVFVGWKTEGDHSEAIGNMRSAFEQLKAVADSFSGMSEQQKYSACTEYVLNSINTYCKDTTADHAYPYAMQSKKGCCQAYTGMLTTIASLSGLGIGTESVIVNGERHCLNYVITDSGIRFIDACWMDSNNSHNSRYYMFQNDQCEGMLTD